MVSACRWGRGWVLCPPRGLAMAAGGRSLLAFPGRHAGSLLLCVGSLDPRCGGSVWWNGSVSPAIPGSCRSGVREVSVLLAPDLPDPQGSGDWSGMGTLFFLTLGSSHSISPPHSLFWRSGKPASWGSLSLLRAQELKWTAFTFLKVPGLNGSHREPLLGWFSGGRQPLDLCPRFLPPASCLGLPGPPLSKSPKALLPTWQASSVSWHTGAMRAVLSPDWRGAALGAPLTKGTSSLSRGSRAPRL